jgi:glutamyl-tRNA reductase
VSLVVTGLNHHTSAVDLREKLAFQEDAIPKASFELRKGLDQAGVVILSTCNRVEIYAHHSTMEENELLDGIHDFIARWRELPAEDFLDSLYQHRGAEAAGHLFRVAASLDSLVLGEAQILGQVHNAYLIAQAEGMADKVIHQLFQKAFAIAKQVRSRTEIGAGNVSISSVAVDLAASIFAELSGKTVMIIGSGQMSELTLKSLVSRGVGKVIVLNRSPERARAIAAPFGGEAVAFEDLDDHLHRADIIISSTAAPKFILHPPEVETALKKRNQAPVFIIDIAVPRDVEPEIGALDNVYLYNVDDLEKVVTENLDARQEEAVAGLEIVEQGAEQFAKWMRATAAEPAIASMSKECHRIRMRELEKTLAALPDLDEKAQQEVAYLTERIVKKILQSPMSQIKHEIGHHDPGTVLHLVSRLFGLKET